MPREGFGCYGNSYFPSNNVMPTRGGGGNLAPSLPLCVVIKWRDMGPSWASREWEGVHLYGYVSTGISTGMGRIFCFVPLSCELHHLKTKGLAQASHHPV